jgi:putative ABC transport system permease protein
MFQYFRLAFRHLWKNKLFSIINIVGLSLGLACCFIILLHIRFETGFDRFHRNRGRIIRVLHEHFAYTPIVMATEMPGYFPEIEKVVRIGKFDWTKFYVVKDNQFVEEKDLMFSDPGFFDVFSFPVIHGNPDKVLRSPDRIMLSESAAVRYFGNDNVVGKAISLRIMNTPYTFTVEGVYRDFPRQSHFHANYLVSMEYFHKIEGNDMFTNWGANSVFTYILLKEPGMMDSMVARMQGFIDKYVPKDFAKNLKYELQPLLRIHLNYEKVEADIETQGSITRVTIFTSIAILVLIIAVVNFLLLSLALSYQRIREFGIRTVAGARRRDLVSLVSAEFLIVFVLAVQIALMLVELAIPLLESRMNFRVYHGIFSNAPLLILFMGLVFLIGYLASIYIALSVSRLKPVEALKNFSQKQKNGLPTRGVLVVFQFSIMTCLLVCLIVMHKQQWLLRNKDLGYRKDLLITLYVPFNGQNKYQVLRDEMIKLPGIVSVSGANYIPPGDQWWIASMTDPATGKKLEMEQIMCDYGLVETLGIKMLEGRAFSREYGSDTLAVLINQTGLKMMGSKNPLESCLFFGDSNNIRTRRTIIGVFGDFHIRNLYEKVQPMLLFLVPGAVQQMAIRLSAINTRSTLHDVEKVWSSVFTEDPIQYVFVDEALRLIYVKEDQAQSMITGFAFLSLMIALLGLFGLSAFALERRTKETGIRKVNGARPVDILVVLTRQFAGWIVIAFVIAVPLSWYAMHRWLQHFAYRTEISWWIFLLAFAISILVAGLTICWRTYLAAIRNPVEALRYE